MKKTLALLPLLALFLLTPGCRLFAPAEGEQRIYFAAYKEEKES